MQHNGRSQLLIAYWPWVIPGLILARLLFNYFQNGLNKIPGPFSRSISVVPRIFSVYHNRSHEGDLALHRQYGKIVRLTPNLLSIADPKEINTIYGIKSKFIKSRFYELSTAYDEEGLVPDTFVLTDKAMHTRMKRNASNAYSLNGLVQMESWIEPVTDRMIRYLGSQAGRPVDMSSLLKDYAMDAVFAVTFGKDFNYIEKGDVLQMYKILEIVSDYMSIFGQIPWIHKFLLKQPLVAKYVFGDSAGERMMLELATAEVENAKRVPSEKGDLTFLQRLLLNQAKDPASINDREIMTHAFGNIAAGSDTTAIALRSTLWFLLKHRDVYDKLYKEVSALDFPVKFTAANQIPYLSAVIQEAMRLHPSVGMVLERLVPEGGETICGYNLPAGTQVGINPWILHRDPEVFPDPDTYRPERWLASETGEEHLKAMNRSFFTFGHGAHTCSGRWISLMEVTKLIPSLILKFDMELIYEKSYDFKNRWFTPQHGLQVLCSPKKV